MSARRKIFLVEDDADDRELFHIFLKGRADIIDVHALENGLQLLEMLNDLPDPALPYMIVLDQNMPKMNGLATLENLKADSRLQNIPVMIYSTYASDLLTEESLHKGAACVFAKPESKEGYEKMIDSFLSAAGSH